MPEADLTLRQQQRHAPMLRTLSIIAYVIGVAALAVHYGFRARGDFRLAIYLAEAVVLGWFIVRSVLRMVWSYNRLAHLQSHWYDWLLNIAVVLTLTIASFMEIADRRLVVGAIIEGGMTLALLLRAVELMQLVTQSRFQPAQILVGSFVVMILVGTMILMLPTARSQIIQIADEEAADGVRIVQGNIYRDIGDRVVIQTGNGNVVVRRDAILVNYTAAPARWDVALFTSTSAVCVTGLVVEPTGTYWSLFGQAVILVLIQLGGLGIMTFSSVFALVLFQKLNLRQSAVLTDLMSPSLTVQTGRVLVFILASTFLIEALGAWSLWGLWSEPEMDVTQRLWYSVFHSVSAFCNAGFAIYDDSLVRYADTWQANLVFPALIIFGGLGFFVAYNLLRIVKATIRRGYAMMRRRLPPPLVDRRRLTLQSKLVLLMTVLLLVGGTGLIFLFESLPTAQEKDGPPQIADMSQSPPGPRVLRAWFMSVTSRTAGFNTADVGSLSASSKFLTILHMFIGAGPGSPAGGIKVTTMAVVLIGVASMLSSRPTPHAFKRRISQNVVLRALVIMMLGGAIVIISTMLVVSLQPGVEFLDALFESASAFGTVGLSTGITGDLNLISRLLIAAVMFAGRVGPLTLFIALPLGGREVTYEYPSESLAIG